jgi:uncharacterized protein YhhL (DUF1145 family)
MVVGFEVVVLVFVVFDLLAWKKKIFVARIASFAAN